MVIDRLDRADKSDLTDDEVVKAQEAVLRRWLHLTPGAIQTILGAYSAKTSAERVEAVRELFGRDAGDEFTAARTRLLKQVRGADGRHSRRTRITMDVTTEAAQALETLAERQGASKTSIVEGLLLSATAATGGTDGNHA